MFWKRKETKEGEVKLPGPSDIRESLTEARASYLYLEHVFKESAKGWESIREFIESHKQIGRELIQKIEYPSETLSLAIIGQNLSALVAFSPLFQNKRDEATRLEDWTLFSLLSDFAEMIPWPPEETLSKVRRWQQLHYQLVSQMKDTGRNPFGDLTGNLLGELFGDNLLNLCQPNTTHIDHFLLTAIADMFTITCSTSFSYWKTTTEKYNLIQ
jgi:hypothetical protein